MSVYYNKELSRRNEKIEKNRVHDKKFWELKKIYVVTDTNTDENFEIVKDIKSSKLR